ncbi:MAG: carbamoyltransferase HypF [Caldisericaceae bacterium]|nr:carbamoyltransferase HypF [Caldisericaceae bacterium]
MLQRMGRAKSVPTAQVIRQRLEINGIVQGVGFRPFVFNLAQKYRLGGFVINTSQGVVIEAEGQPQAVDAFIRDLQSKKPPLAEIISLHSQKIEIKNETRFEILASIDTADNQTLISPDIAVCEDCLRELRDANDRRYQYPFINCTNCGPRFTIIRRVPYDRPNTTMSVFQMCPDCQKEYDDPTNRRFHAQPNACPLCGPHVWLERMEDGQAMAEKSSAIEATARLLQEGKIVAIKGLGGFHLAVDATNEEAVQRLRQRKNREQKPLALMAPDLKTARQLVQLTDAEQDLLTSPQRPIVLLKKKEAIPVAPSVAPNNQRLGIMLPYTPLHYLLFDQLSVQLPENKPAVLVMTSANRSEEPIVIDNDEARQRLSDIADYLLLHNRDILIRADDSVVARFNGQTTFFRRSRGYVPRPVFLSTKIKESVLGVGGELKNTICLTKGNRAFLSQHIGDLENLLANQFFEATIEHFKDILQTSPELIVRDMHPGYFSTQWAVNQKEVPVIEVQHHHAHMAACMAEWQIDEPVIGVILDGTGYGYDGTVWGGEIFIGDFIHLERMACFKPLRIPGGEIAIKQPWRMALSYLLEALHGELPLLPFLKHKPIRLIQQQLAKQLNCPLTSSCGRLFDGASVISGGRNEVYYEAQAAIEFTQAVKNLNVAPLQFAIDLPYIPFEPIIRALVELALNGASYAEMAARFHLTMAHLLKAVVLKIVEKTNIKKIVLSGGVFQNEVLLHLLVKFLKQQELKVFTHRQVPPNDGGIALGQCAIGLRLLESGRDTVRFVDHVHS